MLQYLLVIGSTGCGKTTLLTAATRQLLARRDAGLLILDAKVDGLVAQEQAAARAVRREKDVDVFGPSGGATFDLSGGLMLSVDKFNRDNAYAQQTLQD